MSLSTRCFALVLILALGVAIGCIRSPDKEYGGHGEILSIGAHKPKMLDRVVYTFQGQNYVIAPQQEGTKIAAVKARAVNLKSTQVTLSIDENAAALNTADGSGFKPFESGVRAVETSEIAPKDNPYGSRLWGQFQLAKGYEVAGWFFFEVPEGTKFSDFTWEDVEYVRVRYPE
ncbi:MAG: hypothetical protein ABID84_05825 [Chloroflexota bacterium]